jgi:hypothetical protein
MKHIIKELIEGHECWLSLSMVFLVEGFSIIFM